MDNEELKKVYGEMYMKGSSSWFSDGAEEAEKILEIGDPWTALDVLEIGCGCGHLAAGMHLRGSSVYGIDYSDTAIKEAKLLHPHIPFDCRHYEEISDRYDRVVMQGVLEHLDDPYIELKHIASKLLVPGGDIVTSSPCFHNPRGFVWMALHMVGAVMSKTDLHFIDPIQMEKFCQDHGWPVAIDYCDDDWAMGKRMFADLKQRIPLALRDGSPLQWDQKSIDRFMDWLATAYFHRGATAVYRIKP